jgi:hypothetical protein
MRFILRPSAACALSQESAQLLPQATAKVAGDNNRSYKMIAFSRPPLGSICAALSMATVFLVQPTSAAAAPQEALAPFESDEAFRDFVKRVRKPLPRQERRDREIMAVPAPPPAPEQVTVTGASAASGESITNTQEAGVDEGGIVKNYRDYLVILRRGRLFTVSTGNGSLRPVDSIDAFPPGVSPSGDWYDEMLIAGDRVIVIGYSYARGGTEVNRFRIDARGGLSFEDAYHLRSNDYYSSRNYASRLIGTRLIVYTPLNLPWEVGPDDAFDWLPSVRRWDGRNDRAAFKPMIDGRRIYMPPNWDNPTRDDIGALHTVMDCDLAAAEMRCQATAILGPSSRNFYVSGNAVYVWVTGIGGGRGSENVSPALVYRLPLDGSAPSAAGVHGAPTDQFSFREDGNDGRLNVLVRSEGGGDAMWRPEFSSGAVALMQLPLDFFGDGTQDAPREFYRVLPSPGGDGYAFQNRFVGNYVLYGAGNSWGRPEDRKSTLVSVALRGGAVTELALPHGVDRIEAMGDDAVAIGADARNLNFQSVELTESWRPQLGHRYSLAGATQGETRSHGFYFKPDQQGGGGILGLPVARAARPGYKQLFENSAAIIFLERANRRFRPLGELGAHDEGAVDDRCQASCVDWYGNARPIFMRGRIFALMGYEIVEGALTRDALREVRRVNFAPALR